MQGMETKYRYYALLTVSSVWHDLCHILPCTRMWNSSSTLSFPTTGRELYQAGSICWSLSPHTVSWKHLIHCLMSGAMESESR